MADNIVESGLEYEEVRLEMHARLGGRQHMSAICNAWRLTAGVLPGRLLGTSSFGTPQ
jgi:hypothetical protein